MEPVDFFRPQGQAAFWRQNHITNWTLGVERLALGQTLPKSVLRQKQKERN